MYFAGLFALILVLLLLGTLVRPTLGQSIDYSVNSNDGKIVPSQSNSPEGPANTPQNTSPTLEENSPLNIRILDPTWCTAVGTGNITLSGTSSDNRSGVKIVEVRVDKNKYSTASPQGAGNWSSWSFSIKFDNAEQHRILARATDYSGKQAWDDLIFNSPVAKRFMNSSVANRTVPLAVPTVQDKETKFAFIEPAFTTAAYGNHFYTFYEKYQNSTEGEKVTTDLDFLTANVPLEPEPEYFNLIDHAAQQIKKYGPDSTVSIIRDEDVHNGYIFRPDGTNAYDVLFLLHDEYVTQQGYDNFRTFVKNGGTIVFLDGNMFYAQVNYDPRMCTTTLLKGHDWQFDGKAAVKSAHERYFKENKEWIGSNFLYGDISAPVRFENNPFNYTHFEENYVNNPNATILLDYGARIPRDVLNDNEEAIGSKIATYELNYGKGKVIVLGLYTQNLAGNKDFLHFFDHIILPRALGQPYRYDAAGNEFVGYWWMNTGKISKIEVDNQSKAMILTLENSARKEGNLLITLPRELFATDNSKKIAVNDKEVHFNQTSDDVETGVEIPLAVNATKVQITIMTANNTNFSSNVQAEPSQNRSTGSGSNESVASNNRSSMSANIEIVEGASSAANNVFYKPAIIEVSKGSTVRWTNNDVEVHTVTSGDLETGVSSGKFFDSGYLSTGNTFQHVFNDPRTFDYYCTLHPFMKGKVIVK